MTAPVIPLTAIPSASIHEDSRLRPDTSGQPNAGVHPSSSPSTVSLKQPSPPLEQQQPSTTTSDEPIYPQPFALALLTLGIGLAAFVVALDRSIVATAIPRITDDFNSPADVGWYGSAYLLTSCAVQPTYGRIFAHFDIRWSFLLALALFEIGSLICGLAPSSTVLIIGRAIAGLGCAGVISGCLIIVVVSVPMAKRPIYISLVGAIFGVGVVCGPILGGVFTTRTSWRWCFYFNLPVGAVVLATLLLFFHPPKQAEATRSFGKRVLDLDLPGNGIVITAVTMLLLALQWGGTKYAWKSSQIIGLLVGAGLESLVFFAWLKFRGSQALVPLSIIGQRTVAASLVSSLFGASVMFVHCYYLPYWFQAIRDDSPLLSGLHLVPYVATNFFFTVVAGIVVTKTGYYNPPALLGPVVATIGSGLLTMLRVDTSRAKWVGFEILTSAGTGLTMQQGLVAVQAVLPPETASIGTALIFFAQNLAGAIFVSVCSSILRNELSTGLSAADLPGVNITEVLSAGATEVRKIVPSGELGRFLVLYNAALQKLFIMAIPLAILGLVAALPMEWRNLKKDPQGRTLSADKTA